MIVVWEWNNLWKIVHYIRKEEKKANQVEKIEKIEWIRGFIQARCLSDVSRLFVRAEHSLSIRILNAARMLAFVLSLAAMINGKPNFAL
jgi:hypothetical protein